MEAGRLGVLETFRAIITRFPVEIINDYAQLFYVPLVSRFASDVSTYAVLVSFCTI